MEADFILPVSKEPLDLTQIHNPFYVTATKTSIGFSDVPSLSFVPVDQCVSDGKYHPPGGALEIIAQGAFKPVGDFIGVVVKCTTAPSAKNDGVKTVQDANG